MIVADVHFGAKKLAQQIAMGAVQFDTVIAAFLGPDGGLDKGLAGASHFRRGHRPGAFAGDVGRRQDLFAVLADGAHAAVDQLHHRQAAMGFDALGHAPMTVEMQRLGQAQLPRKALTLVADINTAGHGHAKAAGGAHG